LAALGDIRGHADLVVGRFRMRSGEYTRTAVRGAHAGWRRRGGALARGLLDHGRSLSEGTSSGADFRVHDRRHARIGHSPGGGRTAPPTLYGVRGPYAAVVRAAPA